MITLEYIIPAYQEAQNLEDAVQSVLAASEGDPRCRTRIIIVDDGSTDGTAAIADALQSAHPGVRVTHQVNQGVGGAIRTGIREAVSDFFIIWPADMRIDRELHSTIVSRLAGADVLVGYRTCRVGYSALMRLNSHLFAVAIRVCCGVPFRDVTWISVYRRDLLKDVELKEKGVALFPELLLTAHRNGARCVELEMAMQPRLHGNASAARFKTMIRALTGLMRLCLRFNRFSSPR